MSNLKKPTDTFVGLFIVAFLLSSALIIGYMKLSKKTEIASPETSNVPIVAPLIDSSNTIKDTVNLIQLPDGLTLEAAKGSLEDSVVVFLSDSTSKVSKAKWFDFDNLLFETGKTTLMPSSMKQLNNLSVILKTYSKVKIKIGGYTDNVGSPTDNLKLSSERAANVMAELVKLGIVPERLKSEGYGEQWPVASNETAEGRAKNRRISMRVTEL